MRLNSTENILSERHKMDLPSFWREKSPTPLRFFFLIVAHSTQALWGMTCTKNLCSRAGCIQEQKHLQFGRMQLRLMHPAEWFISTKFLDDYIGSSCKEQTRNGNLTAMFSHSFVVGLERAKHCPSLAEWIFQHWNLIWFKVGLTAMETVFKPLL